MSYTTLCFHQSMSVAVIEGSAIPSVTNRYPSVDILSFISVEIVFNRLSNICLHGKDTRPQAIASLWLYRQSMLRKICNALFESILNHIRTIKHLKIMVGEYIWSSTFPLWWCNRPWYITYQIQNVKKMESFYSIKS